jgi:hypothetical protein
VAGAAAAIGGLLTACPASGLRDGGAWAAAAIGGLVSVRRASSRGAPARPAGSNRTAYASQSYLLAFRHDNSAHTVDSTLARPVLERGGAPNPALMAPGVRILGLGRIPERISGNGLA